MSVLGNRERNSYSCTPDYLFNYKKQTCGVCFKKKYSYDIFMDCSLRNVSCKDGFPVAEGQKTVLL